jgi:hypothetical protein
MLFIRTGTKAERTNLLTQVLAVMIRLTESGSQQTSLFKVTLRPVQLTIRNFAISIIVWTIILLSWYLLKRPMIHSQRYKNYWLKQINCPGPRRLEAQVILPHTRLRRLGNTPLSYQTSLQKQEANHHRNVIRKSLVVGDVLCRGTSGSALRKCEKFGLVCVVGHQKLR